MKTISHSGLRRNRGGERLSICDIGSLSGQASCGTAGYSLIPRVVKSPKRTSTLSVQCEGCAFIRESAREYYAIAGGKCITGRGTHDTIYR